jgi:hypothetical protein
MTATDQIIRDALRTASELARQRQMERERERLERERQREAEEREIVEATRPPLTEHHQALIARRDELAARIPADEDSTISMHYHHEELVRLNAEIAREERLHREYHSLLIKRARLARLPPQPPTRQMPDCFSDPSDVMAAVVRSPHAERAPTVLVDGTKLLLHGPSHETSGGGVISSPFTFIPRAEVEAVRAAVARDEEERLQRVAARDPKATVEDCRNVIFLEQWDDVREVVRAMREATRATIDLPYHLVAEGAPAARELVSRTVDIRLLVLWWTTATAQGDTHLADAIRQHIHRLDPNDIEADKARAFWEAHLAKQAEDEPPPKNDRPKSRKEK